MNVHPGFSMIVLVVKNLEKVVSEMPRRREVDVTYHLQLIYKIKHIKKAQETFVFS